jgi:hypothetical protein
MWMLISQHSKMLADVVSHSVSLLYTKLITIITEWLRIVCREIIIIINVALEMYQHVAWWLLSMYFSTEKEVLGFFVVV